MANTKKPDNKTNTYLVLSLWLLVGFLLVIVNFVTIDFIKSVNSSEVAVLLNLVGFSIFELAGLMIIILGDLLYIVLFMKWIFIGRKQIKKMNVKNKGAIYLP